MKIDQKTLFVKDNVVETLRNCKGYYKRPPNGPLVAYAGSYETEEYGKFSRKCYVGFEYFNFAKVEQYPILRRKLAAELKSRWSVDAPDIFVGAPMGGVLLADSLAEAFDSQVVYAEKMLKGEPVLGGGRTDSSFVLDRHDLERGSRVVIVDDVCDTFSTTEKLIQLVLSYGVKPYAIACFLNRSEKESYKRICHEIPVISLAHIVARQYRQDDPAVKAEVDAANVAWKPKSYLNWNWLQSIMQR